MNFVADEGVDFPIVSSLREAGYRVLSVLEELPGADDEKVLELANKEEAVLITADKDFGMLVYRMKKVHFGVILLRLAGTPNDRKAELLVNFIKEHQEELSGAFSVITPNSLRVRKGG